MRKKRDRCILWLFSSERFFGLSNISKARLYFSCRGNKMMGVHRLGMPLVKARIARGTHLALTEKAFFFLLSLLFLLCHRVAGGKQLPIHRQMGKNNQKYREYSVRVYLIKVQLSRKVNVRGSQH
jgi:hypothetical protein